MDDRRALLVRVLIIDMPRLLRDIIRRSLAGEPWCALVSEPDVPLNEAIDRGLADYVIVGDDGVEPAWLDQRLLERPQVRILAVRADGRYTTLHQLQPGRVDLGEVSPDRLRDAMVNGVPPAPR